MTISLCMIAKNEEDFINLALKSAVDFVDEIIVVDTGSQDKTIEFAKNYDSKVIETQWKNDFSFHRNQAIAAAKCDWIMFLDCDEVLDFENKDEIKDLLNKQGNEIMGYNVNIVNMISNVPVANFSALRVFKNHESFHFQGKIHEQVLPSILNKHSTSCISYLPLTINHYGYDYDVIEKKNKVERNLDILNSIEDKNGYLYAMLGDEYLKLKDFKNAISFYEKSLGLDSNFHHDYSPMLVINYISSLINLGEYSKALDFIGLVKKDIPSFRDLLFLEYWIFYYTKNFEKALVKLDQYINFSSISSQVLDIKRFDLIYNLKDMRVVTISNFYKDK